jgi:hypothetical protein
MIINWHPKSLSDPFQIPSSKEHDSLYGIFQSMPSHQQSPTQAYSPNANRLLLKDTRTLRGSSCSRIIDSIGVDTQMAIYHHKLAPQKSLVSFSGSTAREHDNLWAFSKVCPPINNPKLKPIHQMPLDCFWKIPGLSRIVLVLGS